MLLVLHSEEAYRFQGSSCPTGANIRGQMSYGGKCRAQVQGAGVLRKQMSGGTSRGWGVGADVLGASVLIPCDHFSFTTVHCFDDGNVEKILCGKLDRQVHLQPGYN